MRALTNETGTITDTLVFDAFGNETAKTGSTDNSYGFQGEEKDETGLYYLRARYMDPSTGTFTSMDTYGGSLSDPMSLHKYMFANSNPVMNSDPSGHMTLSEINAVIFVEMCMLSGSLLGMLGTFVAYKVTGKDTDTVEFAHDLSKSFIGGAAIGFVLGLCLIGVFAYLAGSIACVLLNYLAAAFALYGIGIIVSEFCAVRIGISIQVGIGEQIYAETYAGVSLSPDNGVEFIYPDIPKLCNPNNWKDHSSFSNIGGGMSTHTDMGLGISPSVEVYPGTKSNADVESYGPLINAGGSLPVGDGKISGDLLFSQGEGLVGFSIGRDITNDPIPEIHVGVSG